MKYGELAVHSIDDYPRIDSEEADKLRQELREIVLDTGTTEGDRITAFGRWCKLFDIKVAQDEADIEAASEYTL